MIAKLTGTLDSIDGQHCVVDVQGVGYLVQCSTRTLGALAPVGEAVRLLIVTKMREDGIRLFGFLHESERAWFDLLQNVQGVGAKVALAILSSLTPDEIAAAIATGDKAMLSRADGVGAKLAQRLVSELKDKVGDLPLGAEAIASAERAGVAGFGRDAVSALVNLGYRAAQAEAAIAKAAQKLGGSAATSELIRAGLRELAR